MSANKYTLIGHSTNLLTNDSSSLFVHVESATSLEDAQSQLEAVLYADATYATFSGHLDPLDGGHALQLLSDGRLLDRPRSLPASSQKAAGVMVGYPAKQTRTEAANIEMAAALAKKEANKGLSVAERRMESFLDGPTKLHPNAGLGTGTCRDSMKKAVEQGRLVSVVMVRDTVTKKRDVERLEVAHRNNNIPNFTNENLPGMKEINEAYARMKADVYGKAEYRVYDGSDNKGCFFVITKTEYDYVKELEAAAHSQAAPQAAYINIRNELAKSWERKYLDDSGKPLPESLDNMAVATEENRIDARTLGHRRPTPFTD